MADIRIVFGGYNLEQFRADLADIPSTLTKRQAAAIRRTVAALQAIDKRRTVGHR